MSLVCGVLEGIAFCSVARWEGIFVGSELNNGEWQSVRMAVNDSHVFLAANNETILYPINPVQTINSSDTSFSTTVIGKLLVLCCFCLYSFITFAFIHYFSVLA